MDCQILFSEENKKNVINLSSADLAQRVIKVHCIPFRVNTMKYLVHTMAFLLFSSSGQRQPNNVTCTRSNTHARDINRLCAPYGL